MLSYSYNVPILFTANITSAVCSYADNVGRYCGTIFDYGGGFSFVVTGNTDVYLVALGENEYSKYNEIVETSLNYCEYINT